MSFSTAPAVQHRAWNLFLSQETAAPAFEFPFFVAGIAGVEGAIVYTDNPSAGFTQATIVGGVSSQLRMLALSPEKAFAIGDAGVYESTDGQTFTLVNDTPGIDYSVVVEPAAHLNGAFCAVLEGDIYYSADGLSWGVAGQFANSVCVHNGAFYASTPGAVGSNVYKSLNGLVWNALVPTSVQAPAFGAVDMNGPIASDGATLYVAVENTGTTVGQQKAVIYGSDDDGLTWTIRRTLLSATLATLNPAAGAEGSGVVFARDNSSGRHINVGSGFNLLTSPASSLVPGLIGARRGSLFECDLTGVFAISTNGGAYNGYLCPLDTVFNVA